MAGDRHEQKGCGFPILNLPSELRALILDNVNPFDLFNASLTCHVLHQELAIRLSKQADLHAVYHLQHDRPPKAMLELLRQVKADDVASRDASWHIRDLELWDYRLDWTEWKTYDWCVTYNGETDSEEPLGPHEDYSSEEGNVMAPGEMDAYAAMIASECRLTAEESAEWIELMRQGVEEPLKGLVIAFAPHLRSVKFIQYDSWQGRQRPHPLRFLCTMINRHISLPPERWPLGLHSLQYVSVCASTSMKHPHDMFYCQIHEVIPLFKLPNLATLNLAMINAATDGNQTVAEFDLPARCSSVRHLGLYLPDFIPDTLERVLAASRNLETLTWTNEGSVTIRAVLRHLNKYHHSTIRKIRLPMNNVEEETAYPAKLLHQLPLREIVDFPITALLEQPKPSETAWSKRSGEWLKNASVVDMREIFPPSLEKISIRAPASRAYGTPYEEHRESDRRQSKQLFARLYELVNDPRFSNLKSICCDSAYCQPSFDMSLLAPFEDLDVDIHRPEQQPGEWDGEGYESWHLGALSSGFRKHQQSVHVLHENLDVIATDPRPPAERD